MKQIVTVARDGKNLSTISTLHDKARRAIESGENNFREAAEYLAKAQELGTTQRESAKAIGKSPAWVNALLKWRKEDYRGEYPFRRSTRRVQAAEQRPSARPTTQVQIAKAEAKKARAEAVARMFAPETKRIPSESREALIAALQRLSAESAADRAAAAVAVERERASLGLTWPELIVPAAAETELRAA